VVINDFHAQIDLHLSGPVLRRPKSFYYFGVPNRSSRKRFGARQTPLP